MIFPCEIHTNLEHQCVSTQMSHQLSCLFIFKPSLIVVCNWKLENNHFPNTLCLFPVSKYQTLLSPCVLSKLTLELMFLIKKKKNQARYSTYLVKYLSTRRSNIADQLWEQHLLINCCCKANTRSTKHCVFSQCLKNLWLCLSVILKKITGGGVMVGKKRYIESGRLQL